MCGVVCGVWCVVCGVVCGVWCGVLEIFFLLVVDWVGFFVVVQESKVSKVQKINAPIAQQPSLIIVTSMCLHHTAKNGRTHTKVCEENYWLQQIATAVSEGAVGAD